MAALAVIVRVVDGRKEADDPSWCVCEEEVKIEGVCPHTTIEQFKAMFRKEYNFLPSDRMEIVIDALSLSKASTIEIRIRPGALRSVRSSCGR